MRCLHRRRKDLWKNLKTFIADSFFMYTEVKRIFGKFLPTNKSEMDSGNAGEKTHPKTETENMDEIECKTSKIGVVVVQSPREMEKNFYRQQK